MLNECYKYAAAINAKDKPFPAEPSIMACCYHNVNDLLVNKTTFNEDVT